MKIKPGLIKKDKKFIQKNQWYHQRFDGCPQFILVISEAELKKESRKFVWGSFGRHWGFFKDNTCDWYIDQQDIKRITNNFIVLSKQKGGLSKKNFYQYCYGIDRLNLKNYQIASLKKFI
ncbi:MAG: hypothetical protein UW98_C0034G0013 [Parcubacteria group bacterium GW2011_GWC2_45_15]|nr:MAG: hypothetical protein UW98_C0034G0013 [Parcubacteria group bacterium GW2011_GWC2_45_15]